MLITKYHGKYVEMVIYITINALIPLISRFFGSFDFSTRFYFGIFLFAIITVLNFFRTLSGGYVKLVYWITILLNMASLIFFGMVSYIYAARILPYLF